MQSGKISSSACELGGKDAAGLAWLSFPQATTALQPGSPPLRATARDFCSTQRFPLSGLLLGGAEVSSLQWRYGSREMGWKLWEVSLWQKQGVWEASETLPALRSYKSLNFAKLLLLNGPSLGNTSSSQNLVSDERYLFLDELDYFLFL